MSDSATKAVFLSYASQDAEAARRICDALRAAGVEVWFDQSELRGGDSWDAKIRRQIKECALFMPVISANTNIRPEGYFRLEWKLAVDRSHLLADDHPFLFPVVIGEVTDANARVPDKFRDVQWTRLKLEETPTELASRVARLLTIEHGAGSRKPEAGRSRAAARGEARPAGKPKPAWLRYAWAAVGILFAVIYAMRPIWQPTYARNTRPPAEASSAAAPLSLARQLANRADAMLDDPGDKSSTNMGAAAALCAQAETLDPNDAEIWAVAARIDALIFWLRFDASDEQRQRAQQAAAKAIALAPDSRSARRAQAYVFASVVATPESIAEAERIFRGLLRETPGDKRLSSELAMTLFRQGRVEEAVTLFGKADSLMSVGWACFATGRFAEANKAADSMLARERSAGALYLKAHVELFGFEDPGAAQQTISELPPAEAQTENGASIALFVAYCRREPEKMLRVLEAFPQNFLTKQGFYGPKHMWTGVAQEMAGHREAAEAEWTVALQQVLDRHKDRPGDLDLLVPEALLRAQLGRAEAAEKTYRLYLNLSAPEAARQMNFFLSWILLRLGHKEEALASFSDALKGKNYGWEIIHATTRLCPHLDPLRGDPRFEKLLRDTLPPGAKPFDDPKP